MTRAAEEIARQAELADALLADDVEVARVVNAGAGLRAELLVDDHPEEQLRAIAAKIDRVRLRIEPSDADRQWYRHNVAGWSCDCYRCTTSPERRRSR